MNDIFYYLCNPNNQINNTISKRLEINTMTINNNKEYKDLYLLLFSILRPLKDNFRISLK